MSLVLLILVSIYILGVLVILPPAGIYAIDQNQFNIGFVFGLTFFWPIVLTKYYLDRRRK